MDFNTKLKKYTMKNLKINRQAGGIIGEIPLNKLDEVITYDKLPDDIQNYIKIITIPDTHVIPVGSGTLRIQRFPSDVDVMNIMEKSISTENIILLFIDNLKNIIKTLTTSDKVMFSDFKAGSLHWKSDQILGELNGTLSLRDACKMKGILKLDMFAPYNRRYVEMSTFFILKSNDGFVNVDKDYFDKFQQSLFDDIQHYREEKPFKAVKRLWSLSRITHDIETMNKIESLINSNISLLSQINADIETLKLMVNKKSKYNKEFVLDEIDNFKERLSHILDIEFDEKMISDMIDNMELSFKYDSSERTDNLDKLHDYILSIINKETFDYLKKINFELPTTLQKTIANQNSIFNHDAIVNSLEKSKLEKVSEKNSFEIPGVNSPKVSSMNSPRAPSMNSPRASSMNSPRASNMNSPRASRSPRSHAVNSFKVPLLNSVKLPVMNLVKNSHEVDSNEEVPERNSLRYKDQEQECLLRSNDDVITRSELLTGPNY